MSLHGKKGLGKKNRKGWRCDKILVHLKEFAPSIPLTSTSLFLTLTLHGCKLEYVKK